MKCEFVVGQKVECIEDCYCDLGGEFYAKVGEMFTVGRVGAAVFDGREAIGLGFVERPSSRYCFDPACFRPLTERKTDISVLTKMLLPTEERVG
jgi:hypothetical protein